MENCCLDIDPLKALDEAKSKIKDAATITKRLNFMLIHSPTSHDVFVQLELLTRSE